MKKNYNINLNPKPLSSEEISKFKDFDALLAQYNTAKPPQRTIGKISSRVIYISSLAAAAMIALLFYFVFDENFSEKQSQYFASRNYVDPPMMNVKPQFASYKFNANQGGVYEYESGSKLKIPASAFIDNDGNPIEGNVEIKYREFHDYVDFFLSGIPMTYDSAGVSYTLESAGMMEVYAEKDGKRVKMAPGKTIAVELVSNVNVSPQMNRPPNYNIYRLDEDGRKWIYEDVDNMQLMEEKTEFATDLSKDDPLYPIKIWQKSKLDALDIKHTTELAKIEASIPMAEEPIQPQKNNGSTTVFSLDISDLDKDISKEYEEAKQEVESMNAAFKSMLWQKSPQSKIALEKITSPEDGSWDGMRLRKVNNRDFELTLIEGNEAIKILINPVLSGNDYDLAMENYDQELNEYMGAMENRKELLKEQIAALNTEIEKQKQAIEAEYQDRLKAFQQKGQDYAVTDQLITRKVINRFEATSFGIWNCDRPLPPYMVKLKAKFVDQNGKNYDSHTAYLVDKSRNTVTKFLATDGTELRFNMNSENLLWVINGNKLAVFRPEAFKRLNQPKGSHIFELDLVDTEVNSEEEARKILYF